MTRLRTLLQPISVMVVIVILASVLRLYQLESAPRGALIDEASYGYIGYSLLQTGRDEHGNVWPLHFFAFGDQKLPAYAYILVPVIKIFGLNNFAVRLPSALAGILLVPVMYLISRRIGMSITQGFISAMIVAVSPWTIILSRFGFESNIALLFFAIGIYTAIRTLQTRHAMWLVFTALFLALCWYAYIPYRIITMLFSVGFVLILSRMGLSWKNIILYSLTFLLCIMPLLPHTVGTFGSSRLNQARYIQTLGSTYAITERRAYCQKSLPDPVCKLFVNKYSTFMSEGIVHYLQVFGPEFLFFAGEGDILTLSIAGYGVLYLPLILLYIAGIFSIRDKGKGVSHTRIFILVLLLTAISALPSALVGEPQRVRLSAVVPGIVLLLASGYGLVERYLRQIRLHTALFLGVSCALIYCTGAYVIDLLYVHYPRYMIEYSSHLRDASEYIHTQLGNETVYYEELGENYPLYYAYYNKIDPTDYQRDAVYTPLDEIGFSHPVGFRNIQKKDLNTDELVCLYRAQGKSFDLMTSEDLVKSKTVIEPPIYRVASGDGNSDVLRIYHIDPQLYPNLCVMTDSSPTSL